MTRLSGKKPPLDLLWPQKAALAPRTQKIPPLRREPASHLSGRGLPPPPRQMPIWGAAPHPVEQEEQ